MSFDLTIRSDARFSKTANVRQLVDFIGRLPDIQWNGRLQFTLEDEPSRYMEINLELVDPDGDCIGPDVDCDIPMAEDSPKIEINCIRLHIPYAFFGDNPDRDYLPTAIAIAEFLGWQLYDEQRGLDLPGS